MPTEPRQSRLGGRRGRVVVLAASLLAALIALAANGDRAPAQSARSELEDKLGELDRVHSRQDSLEATIARQNREVDRLLGEVGLLKQRERTAREQLQERQAELDQATAELEREREHLREVRARLARAIKALEGLLVDIYKSDEPDALTIVLGSRSLADIAAESEYFDRVQSYDETLIARVRELRTEVAEIVAGLEDVRERIETARDEVAARHAELADARASAESRWQQLVAAREQRQSTLAALRAREEKLSDEIRATGAPVPGETAQLVDGIAIPPPGAPLAVRAVIEAANEIADEPYRWGGGHGSWQSDGYDCSGAISYALHGGGLLDSPLDSTGFTVYGEPGAGSWITVYAHSGHAYAVIAGLRWDTGGNGGGSGPRWHTDLRETAGYVARHPGGY